LHRLQGVFDATQPRIHLEQMSARHIVRLPDEERNQFGREHAKGGDPISIRATASPRPAAVTWYLSP